MTSADDKAKGDVSVVVATHGHCFDGLCSAFLFTRLMKHLHGNKPLAFRYHGSGYGPGQNGVDPKLLSGDINAILDFRFSVAPALTWYFDHHVSAFPSAEDRSVFDARVAAAEPLGTEAQRFFHDGAYTSCTKLIADVSAKVFGLNPEPVAELVRWADMIDSAAFPSAKMAVDRSEPVLKLMTVVEHMGDDAFLSQLVPRLFHESLDDVARAPEVLEAFAPLQDGHQAFVKLVAERAVVKGDVVLVDLSDKLIEVAGKFVTYALYPSSAYSVVLSRSKSKCKLSIGFNPWCGKPRRHNIAAICERHGGGGQPGVGAVSVPADEVAKAQELARDIAHELAE
jgi:hypothetical protein